jgi:dihydrolipoamide dehydrogenase
VAVVGAGVIGLELAQALHRLGVRVRLYGRGQRVGPAHRPGPAGLTPPGLRAELPLSTGPRSSGAVERDGDQVIVHTADGRRQRARGTLSTGCWPPPGAAPTSTLGLETSGLPLDAAGVPVYDRRSGQAGDSPVFIAGDAGEDRPLLHEAADEGRIAGDNAGRWPDVRVRPRRAPLAVVFSEPQIALAGASATPSSPPRAGLSPPARCPSTTRAAAA